MPLTCWSKRFRNRVTLREQMIKICSETVSVYILYMYHPLCLNNRNAIPAKPDEDN